MTLVPRDLLFISAYFMQLHLRNFLLFRWNGAILCPLWALLPWSAPVLRSPFPLQRILDVGRWWLFFEAEKKHVATRYFCESSDSDSWRKCFSDSFAEEDWESLCKLWMECISLTSTVQTEALRGIGIYRWQGGKKRKEYPLVSWSSPFPASFSPQSRRLDWVRSNSGKGPSF